MRRSLEYLGARLIRFFEATGEILILFARTVSSCRKAIQNRQNIMKQMAFMGVGTLPIALLMGFFIGMVLALQTGYQLLRFNLEGIIGAIVGLSLAKELGPVLTGYLVAGRVGAAITAEIGTMEISEEIDALRVMGVDPVFYLSMPRLIAAVFMVPIIVIYVNAIGIIGGAIISATYVGVGIQSYFDNLFDSLTFDEVFRGLLKAMFFGGIVATIGCYKGFKTTGGAEGVGVYTTQSVVLSFILIVVFDYFLSRLLL
ncbi:MAG: ABC transporter permease [Candidatus Abyssobacteria bacterium SURF_17]|jgi:phospholipid/cholesterol/gamma-HCH transport system permease protein|uniref:ABC transporter permease n=1 Tax=Candidatus Abyssobacteria bacterium SURF_17 TaxID=2093361 RepID=A0A419ES70_9BACT|nr:MAG: ABC transporter permease [Candidatus Abyssubacteria bacterium SURF_17]